MGLGRVSIPSNSSFEQTARVLNDLVRKMPQATEAIKDAAKLRDGLTDVTKRVKQAKEAADTGNKLAKQAQSQIDGLKKLGEQAKEAKKVTDALKAGKWANIGGKFAQFMKLGFVALTIFNAILGAANAYATIQISESTIRQFEQNGREFATQFRLIQKAYSRLKNLEDNFKKLKGDLDATKKTVYADVQNLLNQMPKVRKTANDALYEVRAGRTKLESKIADAAKKANDALYETRQGKVKSDAQLALIKKQANDALYEVRKGREKIDARISDLNVRFSKITSESINVVKRLTIVESKVSNIKPPNQGSNNQGNNNDVVTRANFPTLIQQQMPAIAKATEPYTAKFVDGKLESFKREFDGKITKKLDGDKLVTEIQTKAGNIIKVLEPSINAITKPFVDTQLKPINKVIDAHGVGITNLLQLIGGFSPRLDKAEYRLDKEGIDNDKQMIDIEGLKRSNKELIEKVREQEKVNNEGNKKLDDLLKWTLGISPLLTLIPRKAADLINPNIPNINQIGQAVRNNTPSTCRFSEAPIYAAAGQVNAHSTALDVVQTGLITANTGIVTNINNTANIMNAKLGAQLPNGISGFLQNFLTRFNQVATWLHLDRILNVLIWWQTLHNAAMLSSNVVQTLASGVNNVLSLIGIKDAEGNNLDIGSVVGKAYTDMLKGALGEETYNNINKAFNAANRIYQSVTNLANLVQSMQQTILTALEYIGAAQGKVANALKAAGKVFENAYEWMNVQPNFDNPIFMRLAKFQETASTIEQITQIPVDIKSNIEQMKEEKNNMKKALEDGDNALKGLGVIESENEKKKATESKQASQGKDLESIDKAEADD